MKAPEVIFDAQENTFTRQDTGYPVPEISRLLQDAGQYDLAAWGAENNFKKQQVLSIIHKGRVRFRDDYQWLHCFRAFCNRTGFVPEKFNTVLYNDQLNYACRVPVMGSFDYSGTIKAKYPAIVEVLLPGEPHAAGLLLSAYKLAAVRSGHPAMSSARLGIVRLHGGFVYEYHDMTDAAFECALYSVVKGRMPGSKK